MNIFNHILPDDAILGIGPLMVEHSTDFASAQMYGTRRLYFDLHLSAHTTKVHSDWFSVKSDSDDFEKYKAWREHYYVIRKVIAARYNEDPTEQEFVTRKPAQA